MTALRTVATTDCGEGVLLCNSNVFVSGCLSVCMIASVCMYVCVIPEFVWAFVVMFFDYTWHEYSLKGMCHKLLDAN